MSAVAAFQGGFIIAETVIAQAEQAALPGDQARG